MSQLLGPVLLGEHHVLDGFDCGDEALDAWLAGKALRNQVEGSSRTWVVTVDDRVVAFYASSTAVLDSTAMNAQSSNVLRAPFAPTVATSGAFSTCASRTVPFRQSPACG